jgi:hypothetical protein
LATKFQGKQNVEKAQKLVQDQHVILSNGERAKLEKLGVKCGKGSGGH